MGHYDQRRLYPVFGSQDILPDRLADQEERQIVSYDQIGCGNSYLDGQPDLWVMETWIGELEEIRRQLSLPEVILLGQSSSLKNAPPQGAFFILQ